MKNLFSTLMLALRPSSPLFYAMFAGVFALAVSGCGSAIGFGIGAIADSSKPKSMECSIEAVPSIPKNSPVQIFFINGAQQEGLFLHYFNNQHDNKEVQSIVWYDRASKRQIMTPLDEVERVVVKSKRNGKWVGLGVGGVLDLIVTAVALNAWGNAIEGLFDFY